MFERCSPLGDSLSSSSLHLLQDSCSRSECMDNCLGFGMQEEERAIIDQSNQAREQGSQGLADLIIAYELVSLKRQVGPLPASHFCEVCGRLYFLGTAVAADAYLLQSEAKQRKLLEKELEIAKLNASRKVLLNKTMSLDARGLIGALTLLHSVVAHTLVVVLCTACTRWYCM